MANVHLNVKKHLGCKVGGSTRIMGKVIQLLVLLLVCLPAPSFADRRQGAEPMVVNVRTTAVFNIREEATDKSPVVPFSETTCLDQAWRQQGQNVEGLIQRGVSDQQPYPLRSGCRPQFAQRPQQIEIDIKLAFEQCRGSKDPNIKVPSCSFVIQRSKNKSQVERAYNSRGLANMGLKNFSSAVQDFSRAIELDKKNAGYVDNRQGAFFALGQLDRALEDAE